LRGLWDVEGTGEKKRHAKFWSGDSKVRLFIEFKKAYDSGRREVLYNILIQFGVHVKLERLIKMCLNETCSRV
jgi:hypothetical protein